MNSPLVTKLHSALDALGQKITLDESVQLADVLVIEEEDNDARPDWDDRDWDEAAILRFEARQDQLR